MGAAVFFFFATFWMEVSDMESPLKSKDAHDMFFFGWDVLIGRYWKLDQV